MKDLLDKSKNPSGWAIGGLVITRAGVFDT
jgi:hypothetical protein